MRPPYTHLASPIAMTSSSSPATAGASSVASAMPRGGVALAHPRGAHTPMAMGYTGSMHRGPDQPQPPAPQERDEGNNGVEVCLFDESPDDFSSAVRAISELAAGEPEPSFPDAEVERLSSSITFLRDPYRPLWELSTAPRAVLSLHWLKDVRGIAVSLEDGTLKFLSLSRIANDVPVTGRPFAGTKTQGVSTYQLSEYLIWNVHVSEITGYAAYCGADGTAVRFQLTSRFWEKEPGRNRVPYFLCGSLAEEGTVIKIGGTLQHSPLPNVPLVAKKGPKAQDIKKRNYKLSPTQNM